MNTTHTQILEAFLNFPLQTIQECPPNIALRAIEAISSNEKYNEFKQELTDYDLVGVVDQIRKILNYPYVGQESGFCMYAVCKSEIESEEKNSIKLKSGRVINSDAIVSCKKEVKEEDGIVLIAKEKEGLLSLSHANLTKNEVVEFIKSKVEDLKESMQSKLSDLKDSIRFNLENPSEDSIQKKLENSLETINQLSKKILHSLTFSVDPEEIQGVIAEHESANSRIQEAISNELERTYFSFNTKHEVRTFNYVHELRQKIDFLKLIPWNLTELKSQLESKNNNVIDLNDKLIALQNEYRERQTNLIRMSCSEEKSKLKDEQTSDQVHLLETTDASEDKVEHVSQFSDEGSITMFVTPKNKVLELKSQIASLEKELAVKNAKILYLNGSINTILKRAKDFEAKEVMRQKTIQWLKCLSRGEFKEAEKIFSETQDIFIHATDNLKQNALYYAVKYNNISYAKELVITHKLIATSETLDIIFPEQAGLDTALQATKSQKIIEALEAIENFLKEKQQSCLEDKVASGVITANSTPYSDLVKMLDEEITKNNKNKKAVQALESIKLAVNNLNTTLKDTSVSAESCIAQLNAFNEKLIEIEKTYNPPHSIKSAICTFIVSALFVALGAAIGALPGMLLGVGLAYIFGGAAIGGFLGVVGAYKFSSSWPLLFGGFKSLQEVGEIKAFVAAAQAPARAN